MRRVDDTLDEALDGDDEAPAPRNRRYQIHCSREGATPLVQKRLEALTTAVLGGYGLVYCLSHWLGGGISPADLLRDDAPPSCGATCISLLVSYWALVVAGARRSTSLPNPNPDPNVPVSNPNPAVV